MNENDAVLNRPTATNGTFPEPATERWQPLRSGLLNIFRYDYEEFRFEQGRLLLRGNNGTGKSRVLALQLPFLFDGEVSPHRVEPDGDPAKRIEWNLLMGRYPDRLGYTWIEFGRLASNGPREYITLGIGLYAIQGRGAPDRWYFVTKQRVGRDLFLQSSSGHPLTADSLAECIGPEGQPFATAKDYRRAVDQALFKLGEQRYRSLVDLLIQLRQPQLSRDLDERKLSSVLSEALPPVAQQVITDVAESFRGLESDRRELDRFQAASDSVDAFLREYRQYARIAARRRAEGVRVHHSAYEATQRRLKAARIEKDEAVQKLDELERKLTQLHVDEKGAAAEAETLENSPQMRSARDLEAARKSATERLEAAEECRKDHNEAIQNKLAAEKERDRAISDRDLTWAKVGGALQLASSQASSAGMQAVHQTGISLLDLPDLDDRDAVGSASELLDGEAPKRRKAVRHVQALESAMRDAENRLSTAKQVQVEWTSQVDAAVDRQRSAQDSLNAASQAQIKAYREWAGRVEELSPASMDLFSERFRVWCETGSGKSPMARAVQDALAATQQKLASEVADQKQLLAEVCAQIEEMEAEQKALLAGRHEPPLPPYTRGPEARAAGQGAPFWTLIDFREDLSPPERAGLEAALEASGMLDAWVTPEGRLIDQTAQDVFVDIGVTSRPPAAHLGRALQADSSLTAANSPVSASLVEAILDHVGLGRDNGDAWVDLDGSWGNGPLRGAWNKPAAQHIGQSAREARRLERLRELNEQLDAANRTAGGIRDLLDGLARRAAMAKAEADRAPQDDVVVQSLATLTAATTDVNRARSKATEAEQTVNRCRQAVTIAVEKRNLDAKDLGVFDWVDRLQELDDAISDYRQSLATLWPAISEYVTVRHAAKTAEDRARGAATDVAKRYAALQIAEQQASEAVARRDTLESTVGAAAGEILSRLEAVKIRVKELRDSILTTTENRGTARGDIRTAEQKIETEEEKLKRDADDRAVAITALRAFIDAEFLTVAVPELTPDTQDWDAVSPAVDLARRMEMTLSEVAHDEVAWDRNQQGLYHHIQTLTDSLLSRDLRPETTPKDGMLVVQVLFHGRNCSMPDLRQALHDEVTARSTLLEKREREVLENTLIGEFATHLHERIRDGERLVNEMNHQIESRPTSTGMRLRFSWDPAVDGPPGLSEARRRLLGASGVWSPEEREALGRFLHEQIQAVRAANQAGTWQEHLAEALDYRKWHQFGVMRQQDGLWKRLTRQTHGTGSGGEKAVALTIPMFAAAAAHYASADSRAPRLILLDEAFVGIDADMRSKCMGLLCAFDLDFVMTSEREWGCYPTLPGAAIYHLTSREGIDAILTTRWVWNGREKSRTIPSCRVPARQVVRHLLFGTIEGNMADLPRLRETLGVPEMAWLLQAIRRQYERGNTALAGTVTLRRSTTAQREAVDRLLGRRPTNGTMIAVRLDQLGQLLIHSCIAETLQEAVEALTGPLVNRRAIRERFDEEWGSLFADAETRLVDDPIKRSWLDGVRSDGLLRRLTGGDISPATTLLNYAVAIVNRFPEQGILLARLAADVTGDSHALDVGSPLCSLTIRAAALLAGEEDWSSAEARRRAWDAVGVVCDEFSASVLVLNLPGDCGSLTGRTLALFAEHGEPCRLTAGLLIRHPWVPAPSPAVRTVYVCENPSVLAAAARSLGSKSPPVVCTDGQPSTAAHLLLSALCRAGVRLRYHGDFDWGGVRIANLAMRRYGAVPWRMSTTDYLAAASAGGPRLTGSPVVAAWDDALSSAMSSKQTVVHEEQIVPLLVQDLATPL